MVPGATILPFGSTVGLAVVIVVGSAVGTCVGTAVGTGVGTGVGLAVGLKMGLSGQGASWSVSESREHMVLAGISADAPAKKKVLPFCYTTNSGKLYIP